MFSLSDTFKFPFAVYDNGASPRALTNADSTPTGTLVVNGTDVGTTVTVSTAATGRYVASVALSGLSVGDTFYLRVSVTKTPTSGSPTTELVHSQVCRINASIGSVTVSDKTGFKLALDGLSLVTAWTVDINGNLSGSVGSVSNVSNIVSGAITVTSGQVGITSASVTDIQTNILNAINAINQSASKRVTVTLSTAMEKPEAGSSAYDIIISTFDEDGAAVNADTTPTITATGKVSGNLTANLSSVSNPSTGTYLVTYSVTSVATIEQVIFNTNATIDGDTFPLPMFSSVNNNVAETWTAADRLLLQAAVDQTTGISVRSYVGMEEANLDDQLASIAGSSTTAATNTGTIITNLDSLNTVVTDGFADVRTAIEGIPTTEMTPEIFWTHDDRTLSSFPPSIQLLFAQPGVGAFIPGAMSEGWPKTTSINATAGTTIILLARVLSASGSYITQAGVSAATSQVIDPDSSTVPAAVNETVSSIIFNTLQMNGQWSEDAVGYNMRVVISGTRIPDLKKHYKVTVTLTTSAGPIKITWSVQT